MQKRIMVLASATVLGLFALGCAGTQSGGSELPPVSQSKSETPAATPADVSRPAVPHGWISFVLAESEDLDGDGKGERVEIQCKRDPAAARRCDLHYEEEAGSGVDKLVLYISDIQFDIEDQDMSLDSTKPMPQRFGFQVVDISPRTPDRQIVLKLGCDSYECETQNIYLLSFDGTDVKQLWHQAAQQVAWKDDGTWHIKNRACVDTNTMDVSSATYRWAGDTVVETIGKTVTEEEECEPRGRCPFVYAGEEQVYMGEVLRNYVGLAAWEDDAIEIPRSLLRNGTLKIRIAEEKPNETTYIDSVWLQVGDSAFRPRACPGGWCKKNRSLHELALGESIEMTFENLPTTGAIKLWVNGYYDLHTSQKR